MLTIVADENIPYVREAFGSLGQIRLTPGRAMTSAVLKDADMLLVRSVTRVDELLLTDTKVKFVATATIGTDHVDQAYLAKRGITFASAAGCNANSVSEYVTAAMLLLAQRQNFTLAGKTLGVVGVGNVGSRVVAKAKTLSMSALPNDPPIKDRTGDASFIDLPDLLTSADIVTLHTPLIMDGPYKTFHLADDKFFAKLKPGAILINSSRGDVLDPQALKRAIQSGKLAATVLDVWENEPAIDPTLLQTVDLGTPHIAGYSFDGKVNGTQLIYDAACRFLGRPSEWLGTHIMPAPQVPIIKLTNKKSASLQDVLTQIVPQLYSIEADDRQLRQLLDMPADQHGKHFDLLRKNYPQRREFQNTAIEFSGPVDPAWAATFAGLGFRVVGVKL